MPSKALRASPHFDLAIHRCGIGLKKICDFCVVSRCFGISVFIFIIGVQSSSTVIVDARVLLPVKVREVRLLLEWILKYWPGALRVDFSEILFGAILRELFFFILFLDW